MAKEPSQPADSEEAQSAMTPAKKPLSKKTSAELKREAKARLKHLDAESATEVFNEVLGKPVGKSIHGFVDFLRENAVVGLAVGFVLGTQVQVLMKQFISSFVDPTLKFISGSQQLDKRSFTLNFHSHSASFAWGAFVYAAVDFLFVVASLYLFIKVFKLDKLDKKKK